VIHATESDDVAMKVEQVLGTSRITDADRPKQWDDLVRAQARRVAALNAKRVLGLLWPNRWHRGQPEILAEYDRQWRKKKWDKYRINSTVDGAPWVWRDRQLLLSNEAGAAVRLIYLDAALTSLRPRSVLEVGCGNGINLLLLAAAHPGIEFSGIEPTESGWSAAQKITEVGRLPDVLRQFSPLPVADESAVSRICFKRGSAAKLSYKDDSFDTVFTSLALEQMEAIRAEAMAEIVRVAKSHVIMLEPFADVNASGLRRRYVKAYDYFQGALSDLPRFGLEVVSVMTDMPHKAWLGTALVVATKSNVAKQPA
jgi:SAM-dependent methyltransferase